MVGVEASIRSQADRYGTLKTPGGILFGSRDPVLSPLVHGAPMRQFGLSVEELEGKGHMILITEPQTCADFVRRVVNEATSGHAEAENG